MSYTLSDLKQTPNKLAEKYSQFNVEGRILLTGHSHQAWPDVAFDGMQQCWDDAAAMADDKWDKAFEKAAEVREGFAGLLDDEAGFIALSANTHDLLIRFLSALPLKLKPRLITTDGEFHTLRRQLSRLSEEGIEIKRVPSYPIDLVADQIISQLDDSISAVMVSSVFFETGLINPGLKRIAEKCSHYGVELFIDAYHSLNVAPFSIMEDGLQNAFVVGGGYKYCQLGEGNCFMRFPQSFTGRPVITGWFSEFSQLAKKHGGPVEYGQGQDLFAGSTYDPISHYRAAAVFNFFREQGLNSQFLREVSQHQVSVLWTEFLKLDLPKDIIRSDNTVKLEDRAGFLVLISDKAGKIHDSLRTAGVLTDYRGKSLRLGPAPYLSDQQLIEAIEIVGRVVKGLK